MNVARRPHMGMNVDQTRNNGLAGNVDRIRARWNRHLSFRTDGGDSIVRYDDVAALDYLIALHRDEPRAAQHNSPLWTGARRFDDRFDRFGFVGAGLLSVKPVAPRPRHPLPIGRPLNVIASFDRHFLNGNSGRSAWSDADVNDFLAAPGHCYKVMPILKAHEGRVPVG